LSEIDQRLQQLTNAVLAGKADEARQSTYAALAQGSTKNDILDAVAEAVNIIIDLNDVEEYDHEKLGLVEGAVNSSLHVIEDKLAASEGKFNLKATVGPVGLKAGSLLSLAVSNALRSIGFHVTNLSKTKTPLELLRNSEELGADLVIPLLAREDVEGQLRTFLEEIERGGFKTKFEIVPVAPGLSGPVPSPIYVARDFGEAISRATEWALKKGSSQRGQRGSSAADVS
jgi:methanogenic corrinoid protein MtbC1